MKRETLHSLGAVIMWTGVGVAALSAIVLPKVSIAAAIAGFCIAIAAAAGGAVMKRQGCSAHGACSFSKPAEKESDPTTTP